MVNQSILSNLPSMEDCRRIFKAIAMLDAIIMPEWEYRRYSFNSKWHTNEMLASMRDDSGEHYFALFNQYGLIIKGLEHYPNHDTQLAAKECPKIFRNVPIEFQGFMQEPAFIIDETSFCIWTLNSKEGWYSGKEYSLHELYLLDIIKEGSEGYADWAREYYETDIDLDIIEDIFNLKPLNQDMVNALNNEVTLQDIQDDIIEIGYPIFS